MRTLETIIAWSLLITGGLVGTFMVVIGMLELLPAIVRGTWRDIVHH